MGQFLRFILWNAVEINLQYLDDGFVGDGYLVRYDS